jgi:hypothetical protein
MLAHYFKSNGGGFLSSKLGFISIYCYIIFVSNPEIKPPSSEAKTKIPANSKSVVSDIEALLFMVDYIRGEGILLAQCFPKNLPVVPVNPNFFQK